MAEFNVLPEGVSAQDFGNAIEEYAAIVGDDNVFVSADSLNSYNKIMIPADNYDHAPSGALAPASTEEVQAIIGVCDKYNIPVWPVSTGKNFGYGSAAAATRGQVILDLRRMNKIIEVDAELGTALIEPGVTYQQLKDYLVENNIPLWLSPPAPSAIVSPLGNAVDRGVGYTPYGDNFFFSCGMEVVLADGEVLRTGMGSMPNSTSWQVFKWGYGPSLDGIFTQSNYGIVTKLGMWLMPQPPAFKAFVIRFPDDADIEKAIEIIRPLRIAQVIPNAVVIAHALWEGGSEVVRSDYYQGEGSISDDAVERMKADLGMGAWNIYAGLYGTPEQIELNWNIVNGAFAGSGAIIQDETDMVGNSTFEYRAQLMRGEMTLKEFGLYNWRGGGGSAWFAPVAQARGSEGLRQMELAKEILGKYGFDYVAEYIIGWREGHHIIDLLFDKTNAEETARANQCFDELLREFSQRGWGSYRTNIAFMDKVANTFGPVKRDVDQRIKRALDPKGIIAPGKSGIYT
ncbi:MAG: FAD-binding oxidoreductase [Pseudohongiellaceae bacterium]|jgi:4-cresol dehydrogenase (hydroxylating)